MKTKAAISIMLFHTCFLLTLSGQQTRLIIGELNDSQANLINTEGAAKTLKANLSPDAVISHLRIQWVEDEGKYFLLARVDNAKPSAIAMELDKDGELLYALSNPVSQLECTSDRNCTNCDWSMVNLTTLVCNCVGSTSGQCSISKTILIN